MPGAGPVLDKVAGHDHSPSTLSPNCMTLSPVPEALLLCSVLILLAFTPPSGSTEAVGVDAPERAIVITPITPTMVITDRALICFLAIFFENRLPILNSATILLSIIFYYKQKHFYLKVKKLKKLSTTNPRDICIF